MTSSGAVEINKRSPYGKWLQGYLSTGAWSGWFTRRQVWEIAENYKTINMSWYDLGVMLGRLMVAQKLNLTGKSPDDLEYQYNK